MKFSFKYKWLLFTLLIWAIIFCVPSLRVLLKAMVVGSPWINFSVIPNRYIDSRFSPESPELPIKVHSIKGGFDTFEWPKNFETLKKLDVLIRQNPNLPWLIALRLQVTTVVFQQNRLGGELSDVNLPEHLKANVPSPETNGKKVNFTPEQMQQALEFCQQGEKLEPQNAFFSWMHMYFLLINWQDQKAWQALDEAAHKTYWNDHFADFINLYTNSVSKELRRPLLPMEKLDITSLSENPFPQSGRLREICRIINWEGIKFKREGKNAQALQIWNNFHHTMFLATQGEADLMGFLIDSGMLSIAQSGATYPRRIELKKEPENSGGKPIWPDDKKIEKDRETRLKGFIHYAEKYRRPDWATQIKKEAQQVYQLLQQSQRYNDGSSAFPYTFNFQYGRLQTNGILFLLSVALILTILGSLLLWLILTCCRFLPTHKSTFIQEPSTPDLNNPASRSKIWKVLWLFVCIVALIYLFGSITKTTMDTLSGISNGWLMLPFSIHFSLDNFTDKFFYFVSCLNSEGNAGLFWRMFILLIPLLATGIYVLQRRMRKQAKTNGKIVLEIWICIASILMLTSLITQVCLNRPLQKWANAQLRGEMWLIHQVKDTPPKKA